MGESQAEGIWGAWRGRRLRFWPLCCELEPLGKRRVEEFFVKPARGLDDVAFFGRGCGGW